MVKIYSTSTCAYCETLKQYLESHNIKFESIDVSENKTALDEMVEKSGQMGVPVLDIDGEIIIGFDKEKVNQLLKIED